MPYKVIIVDDQKIPRQLFEFVVKSSSELELLYSLESASVAHIYCERYPVDLIIMDIFMKDGSNGLDEAARIKRDFPNTRILIVTSMIETDYLRRAREIGVEGFWYKESGDDELLDVIKRIVKGKTVYPSEIPSTSIGAADSNDFTDAELSVLREMVSGFSNKQIADRLKIEVSTVKTHINHMLRKTGFQNRTELAIEARIQGVVIGRK